MSFFYVRARVFAGARFAAAQYDRHWNADKNSDSNSTLSAATANGPAHKYRTIPRVSRSRGNPPDGNRCGFTAPYNGRFSRETAVERNRRNWNPTTTVVRWTGLFARARLFVRAANIFFPRTSRPPAKIRGGIFFRENAFSTQHRCFALSASFRAIDQNRDLVAWSFFFITVGFW